MKQVYLTQEEVDEIYKDLKEKENYEWYITLKIIDETQANYDLLCKLTWGDIIDNDFISDKSSRKGPQYHVTESLKDEVQEIMDKLEINSYSEKIVTTTALDLCNYLKTNYESIKKYKEISLNFRIDFFRDYTFNSSGAKIYSYREVTTIAPLEQEEVDDQEEVGTVYLYIATHADMCEDNRPVCYRTKFWDKKIGKSKDVPKRMNALSKDKRHGGTNSPLYVKGLRAWAMPVEVCHKVEKDLHKQFDSRKTSGEWFDDYLDDLIPLVETKIKNLIKKGYPIVPVQITKENQDFTFVRSLDKGSQEKYKMITKEKKTFEYKI